LTPRIAKCDPAPAQTQSANQSVDAAAKQLMAADGLLQRNLFDLAAGEYEQFLENNPHHPQTTAARWGLAVCRYRLGQFDQALPLLSQVLADDQFAQKDQLLAMLGYCELTGKKYDAAVKHFTQLINSYPQSPQTDSATLYRAQALYLSGQPQPAAADAAAYLQTHPNTSDSPTALYFLALSQHAIGQNDSALQSLARLMHDFPDSPYHFDAVLLDGQALEAQGKIDPAIEQYRQLITLAPAARQSDAHYALGTALLKAGKLPEAEKELTAAADLASAANRPQILFYRAVCLMERSKFQEALKDFDALPVQSAQTLYRSAYCLQHLGQYQSSHERCQQVAKLPASDMTQPAAELDAENLFQLGKYADAQSAFDALIPQIKDPQRQLLFTLRGAQCDYFTGKFAPAVARLAPLADDPRVAQSPELCQVLFLLGDAELQQGKNGEAEAALKKFLAIASRDTSQARYKLAVAELRNGEANDATATLESLTASVDSPWSQRGLLELGELRYKTGHPDSAAAALGKLLTTHPEPALAASATYLLGWIDFDAGRYAQAAEHWKLVAEKYPDQSAAADAQFQEGIALQRAGQSAEAVAALKSFVVGHPSSADAPQALQRAAAILTGMGRDADAEAILADLAKGPAASDSVLYDLAWSQRKLSQTAAAEESYRRIVTGYPNSTLAPLARTELAELLYADNNFAQAAAMLWPVVSDDKADPKVLAAASYRLAWCYQKQGDYDKAADSFRDFASKFPTDEMAPSALLQAALADSDAGRDEAAQKELADMLKRFPQDKDAPVAMLKLAEVQAAQNDFAGSLLSSRDYLAKYPSSPLAYRAQFSIGWALENQQKYDEARTQYQMVIAATNGETAARAQFQIGETYLAQQKYEQGATALLAVDDVYAYPKWSARALFEAGRAFEQLKQPEQAKLQYTQVLTKYKDAPEAELAQGRLKSINGS
jgi:TolA-binding protein